MLFYGRKKDDSGDHEGQSHRAGGGRMINSSFIYVKASDWRRQTKAIRAVKIMLVTRLRCPPGNMINFKVHDNVPHKGRRKK